MIKKPDPYKPKKRNWVYHLKGIFYAICIALVIRVMFLEPYKIPSESMYPSIRKSDMIIANKFIYGIYLPVVNWKALGFARPKDGNIILFQAPSYESPGKLRELINFFTFGIFNLDNNMENPRYFIKRVVGSPGETISLVDPRKNNFHFQVIKNGNPEILQAYDGKTKPDAHIFYYQEQDNPAVIQYERAVNSFFGEYVRDIVNNIYLPKKGDQLTFTLASKDPQMDRQTVLNAQANHSMISIDDATKINISVSRIIKGKQENVYNNIMSGDQFAVFYYSERPNSILSMEEMDQILLDQPVTVQAKDDYFFAMGDNRDDSQDSRYWGFVPYRYIIGGPMFRYWPMNRLGGVNLSTHS